MDLATTFALELEGAWLTSQTEEADHLFDLDYFRKPSLPISAL